MANNYNRGTAQDQVNRVQALMGIGKLTENKIPAPIGTIEKTEIGKDGKLYGIVRENNKYYIKKSDDTTDVKLNNLEYLGGSHRYKHLYEFNSYNNAEKILAEHLYNVSKDVKKQVLIDEQAEKVDMNLAQTVTSKTMREEIERQRQIMTKASAILNEDAGIKTPERKEVLNEVDVTPQPKDRLSELSIDDDEQILTDADGDGDVDIISLDDELDVADDAALDQQDIQLDQSLVDMIPDLLSKMDDLNDKLERLISDEDDFDVEEIDVDESVVTEGTAGDIDTIAANVTRDQFDYETAQEDPRGRNEIPAYNRDSGNGIDGEIGAQNMHTDTLTQVRGKGENDWSRKAEKIVAHSEGDKLGEGKEFYIVERDGTVHGRMSESEFKSMLNGKKPGSAKGGATPAVSNPFDEKVAQLTEAIFNECVASGIFKIKK